MQNFSEWIDSERRLEQYKDGYVLLEVFLAVRKKDHLVVGILDFRYPLTDFLFYFGEIMDIAFAHRKGRKDMQQKCLVYFFLFVVGLERKGYC